MDMPKKPLEWINIDIDNMKNPAIKAKYKAFRKAQEAERLAREDFESTFIVEAKKAEHLDKEMSLAFGYKYGKLVVAKVDPQENKPRATAKPKFSF